MPKNQSQLGHFIVKNIRGKGRGVFTTKPIKKGAIVEICPVIPFSIKESKVLMKTILGHYIFEWGKSAKMGALPMGYGSLYNHSATPNIDFDTKESRNQIVFTALRDIKAGEELCSNYHNDEEKYGDPIDDWTEGPTIYQ